MITRLSPTRFCKCTVLYKFYHSHHFFKVVPPYKIHTGHLAVVFIVGGKPVAVIISYVISMWKQINENGKVTYLYIILFHIK